MERNGKKEVDAVATKYGLVQVLTRIYSLFTTTNTTLESHEGLDLTV
jgi:hypothetical protein